MSDSTGIAGTAIGSFGLFLQLFDKCTTVYSTWQDSEDIGSDAMVFQIRLDMQVARLKEWGVNWGIYNDRRGLHLLEPHFKRHGDLAVQYVAILSYLLDVLKTKATDNTIISSATNVPLSAANHIARLDELEISDSTGRSMLSQKIKEIRTDASVIERLKWGAGDKKATKALGLIKDMVDELYLFFEPPRADTAAHLVFNSSLASLDLDVLDKLGDTCEDDPLLQGLAYLKTATNALQSRKTALDYVNVTKKLRQLKETVKPDARNSRGRGSLDGGDVLVEWKAEPSALATAYRNPQLVSILTERRVKNIGKLLKFDLKPSELRTLDCLGVVTKSGPEGGGKQYGLIFRIPASEHRTLLSIVKDTNFEIDLGQRFSLAQQVAESTLFLHLAGWLHKGIRSDNILFFGPSRNEVDLGKPYIVGFEYSREAQANNETEGVTDDLEFNLYRHPVVQGVPTESRDKDEDDDQEKLPAGKARRPPFTQIHDVYSLGVVLPEIGLLKSALDILDAARRTSDYKTHTAQHFSTWLIEKEVPKLARSMGKTYRDVVKSCLSGSFADDEKTSIETGLYMNVLRSLATCHA